MRSKSRVTIRLQTNERDDRTAVRLVNEAAFGRADEADLIDSLRAEGVLIASFVAELDDKIVGHILFTRMHIDTSDGSVPAVALAPLAVLPAYQRRGIGRELIRHGLDFLRGQGEEIVLVLGHPDYYPRSGFSTQKAASLSSPFPPEAYMAMELKPGALDGIHGTVKYPAAFGLG